MSSTNGHLISQLFLEYSLFDRSLLCVFLLQPLVFMYDLVLSNSFAVLVKALLLRYESVFGY